MNIWSPTQKFNNNSPAETTKTESKIVTQLLKTIETIDVNKFKIAATIALTQQPPIDLNQILQNGQTVLTFAGW